MSIPQETSAGACGEAEALQELQEQHVLDLGALPWSPEPAGTFMTLREWSGVQSFEQWVGDDRQVTRQ